jgi:GntR family transcriptional regulator
VDAAMKNFTGLESKDNTTIKSGITFLLVPSSRAPIYRQIIQQIEYAILSDCLRPGDRLPTMQSLSMALKINRNTIAKAYGELETRGILETRVGKGTYVSDKKPVPEDDSFNRNIREVVSRFVQDMRGLGVGTKKTARMIVDYTRENNVNSPKKYGTRKRQGGQFYEANNI